MSKQSSELALNERKELPKLAELYEGLEHYAGNTALAVILNAPPRKDWIKDHPTAKKVRYIPIERIEYLLTSIFVRWWVEIKTVQLIANSVTVTVRLYYIDPITGQERWSDGVGASPVQTNQGAGATDFNAIKSAAVQMAAPSAESYAIKDAAQKLGKIFGKDINREDEIDYNQLATYYNNTQDAKQRKRIADHINNAVSSEILDQVKDYLDTPELVDLYNNKQKSFING